MVRQPYYYPRKVQTKTLPTLAAGIFAFCFGPGTVPAQFATTRLFCRQVKYQSFGRAIDYYQRYLQSAQSGVLCFSDQMVNTACGRNGPHMIATLRRRA